MSSEATTAFGTVERMYTTAAPNLTKQRSFYAFLSALFTVYGCVTIAAVAYMGNLLAILSVAALPLLGILALAILAYRELRERRSEKGVRIEIVLKPDTDPELFLRYLSHHLQHIQTNHGDNVEVKIPLSMLEWIANAQPLEVTK